MDFYELNLEQMNTRGLVLVPDLTWASLSMHLQEKKFFPLNESRQKRGGQKKKSTI